MKSRLPKVPPGARTRLARSVVEQAVRLDQSGEGAQHHRRRQRHEERSAVPGPRKGAGRPEERGPRERDAECPGREPAVGGEQHGNRRQEQVAGDQRVHHEHRHPARGREAEQRRGERADYQHQLLDEGVAIELEAVDGRRRAPRAPRPPAAPRAPPVSPGHSSRASPSARSGRRNAAAGPEPRAAAVGELDPVREVGVAAAPQAEQRPVRGTARLSSCSRTKARAAALLSRVISRPKRSASRSCQRDSDSAAGEAASMTTPPTSASSGREATSSSRSNPKRRRSGR